MHSNVGYIVTLALNLSLLLPREKDPKVNNYVLVLYVAVQLCNYPWVLTICSTNGYWVLLGIWWCEHQTHLLVMRAYSLTMDPFSHLPAAASWAHFAERRALLDDRMEAGTSSQLKSLETAAHVASVLCYRFGLP